MDVLTVILIAAALILAVVGIIGAIVPAIPGPPLSFVGLFMAHFIAADTVTWTVVIVLAVVTAFVSVIDYLAPGWFTKWGGGSKQAITGSVIGMIAGLFIFPPVGLIVGPFVGAFVGELMASHSMGHALKVAFYSFLSFLMTTGLKLIACIIMLYYVGVAIWTVIF